MLACAGQNSDPKKKDKQELKINVTNLLLLSALDGSYEYLINEETSFGVGVFWGIGDDEFDFYRKFSLTPYYRQYFSNKYAKGFFVEGFAMLNSFEDDDDDCCFVGDTFEDSDETYTDFALGISIGGKFVTKRGFVTDIYLGLGRNLLGSNNDLDLVGRGGVALGYRF